MQKVRLGGAGLMVSPLCLGTWMFGTDSGGGVVVERDDAHALLEEAYALGVDFIDTANNYGYGPGSGTDDPRSGRWFGPGRSERYIGEWLRSKDREDLVVASKVFWTTRGRELAGLSRKIVRAEIAGTLERLGTDYLDLYYLHGWHGRSPLEETLSVLNDLVREGRVHYVGVSNFTAWQLVKARAICEERGWEPPCVIQPRFSATDAVPYTVDPTELALPDLLGACRHEKVAVCAYSPLAGGFLSGQYERAADGSVVAPPGSRAADPGEYGRFPERWWRVLDAVRSVADEVDATPAQVSLAWVRSTPRVTTIPIVGGRRLHQLREAVEAMELELSDDQRTRISDAGDLGIGRAP